MGAGPVAGSPLTIAVTSLASASVLPPGAAAPAVVIAASANALALSLSEPAAEPMSATAVAGLAPVPFANVSAASASLLPSNFAEALSFAACLKAFERRLHGAVGDGVGHDVGRLARSVGCEVGTDSGGAAERHHVSRRL